MPNMDATNKWRKMFNDDVCLLDIRRSVTVKFTIKLNRKTMLYMLFPEQLLGSNMTADALTVFKALQDILTGDNANQLHDILHSQPRHFEALVKIGVVNWSFHPKKVKQFDFNKFLML